MKKLPGYLITLVLSASFPVKSFSQYILNGSATINSCNCYTLTQSVNTQSGSVWNSNKINLNNPFDFHFNVYLGCQDPTGADGIVFMLQPLSTSIGSTGEGMGFGGISPSVGITLDTWQNNNLYDPADDHISIQSNGYLVHDGSSNNLAGPVQASATNINIEDCQWHDLRITWDPINFWLRAYFDNVLRVETQKNLVATIFNNDPLVYWGFTAATGGANNLQQFCTELNAAFSVNLFNNGTCENIPVNFADASSSFTTIQNYYWDFGDGTTSTVANPPSHYYPQYGTYLVKHVITGLDGCVSDTAVRTVIVGSKPVAGFNVYDTCAGKRNRVQENSTNTLGAISSWTWILDGIPFSNSQQPVLPYLNVGMHELKLVVQSIYSCESDTAVRNFTVKPIPVITITANGGCEDVGLQFSAQQNDNLTTISSWHWNFGDNNFSSQQNTIHNYNNAGSYIVQLFAISSDGCSSDTMTSPINIGPVPTAAFTVRDTCAGNNPSLVNNSSISSGSISDWNWILNGQSFSNQPQPAFTQLAAGVYHLQLLATGVSGCVSDTASGNFTIKNRPVITGNAADGCSREPIQFTSSQLDNVTTIQQWNWNFGDGHYSTNPITDHSYTTGGTFNASITAVATNGCASQDYPIQVKVNRAVVNAGKDTIVLFNTPFTLNASISLSVNGAISYTWSPATGLDNPNTLHPISTLQDNIVYTISVTTAEGCTASDAVKISVFKNSAIYVPTGFTPNADGLNDILKPIYIGVKTLEYFVVYNRWGQVIFKTSDPGKGWDGTINGKKQATGSFAWMVKAVDYTGQVYNLKGITTMLR